MRAKACFYEPPVLCTNLITVAVWKCQDLNKISKIEQKALVKNHGKKKHGEHVVSKSQRWQQ